MQFRGLVLGKRYILTPNDKNLAAKIPLSRIQPTCVVRGDGSQTDLQFIFANKMCSPTYRQTVAYYMGHVR